MNPLLLVLLSSQKIYNSLLIPGLVEEYSEAARLSINFVTKLQSTDAIFTWVSTFYINDLQLLKKNKLID